MPPPHSTISCSTSAPSEEIEHLVLELRADERLRHLHLRPRERLGGAQAQVRLVAERTPRTGRSRTRSCTSRSVCPPARARATRCPTRARTRTHAAPRRARRPRSASGRRRIPRHRQRGRGRRSLRSRRRSRLDVAVLVADGLRAPEDGAGVGIGSARSERCIDGGSAEVAHRLTVSGFARRLTLH